MKSFYQQYKLIILIFLIGFFLRIIFLDQLPSILNRDEAGLGYNAYLLKETGKDEWRQSWPFALKSFGDYKLIGYPVFIIGSYVLFGVNDFAVRFPSALAGSFLIVIAYLFGKRNNFTENQALFFSTTIALTPVFFFYSRIGFEANLALTLMATILYLIYDKKTSIYKDLFISTLLLVAVFTYNTPLLLAPFLIPVIILKRGFKKPSQWLFLVSLISTIIFLAVLQLFSLSSQKSGITIFNDETHWAKYIDIRNGYDGIAQKVFGNRYLYFAKVMAENTIKSFSSSFLVLRGGSHPWHSPDFHGHIYWQSYFLGLIGVILLIKNSFIFIKRKMVVNYDHLIILYLLFISLLPSIVTVDSPHATRSLLFFYLLIYTSFVAINYLVSLKISKYFLFLGWIILVLESGNYFYQYFILFPKKQPDSLRIGYDSFINEIDKKHQGKQIAIVDEDGFSYILTAWYLKIIPNEYFRTIKMQDANRIGFHYGEKLANYRFIVSKNDRKEDEKVLIEYNNGWQSIEF